jgi:DNA-binding MarR family transcriptional regulator
MARREAILERLGAAGRELSDAIVLYHSILAEKLGLGASDWKALGLLERHGPMTAGELSARSGLAPASVTGILDRLERAGWVHRGRDPEDGRRVVVTLDEAAVGERVGACFAGLQRRLAELYAGYRDDELEMLAGFVEELARRQQEAALELRDASGASAPRSR